MSSTIHPRRLFCNATPPSVSSPSGIDASSCVRPSLVAQQERLISTAPHPLLAPSPSSPAFMRTHVEISAIENDVENLVDFLNRVESCDDLSEFPSFFVKQLGPLKAAFEGMIKRVFEDSKTAEPPLPATPTNTPPQVLDSVQLLSADLRHLRTIQKEVRGLFKSREEQESSIVVPRSPSPIRSTPPTKYPASFCQDSLDPHTATKISRDLAGSVKKLETSDGFSNLTLSPTTELYDQVKTNPWFNRNSREIRKNRRSGSLPPRISKDDEVVMMSSISTIPECNPSRQILVQDESLTVSALHSAMARRRAPSLGGHHRGTSDLVSWLRKTATNGKQSSSNRRGSTLYRN
jgi:hypothetical protein